MLNETLLIHINNQVLLKHPSVNLIVSLAFYLALLRVALFEYNNDVAGLI